MLEVQKIPIQLEYLAHPLSTSYGRPLSAGWINWHASDLARQEILKYGGIYLDRNMFIVRPLDTFLKYEAIIAWDGGPKEKWFGTQIIQTALGARFPRLWCETYQDYNLKW